MPSFQVIGKSVPRIDALDKVTGSCPYLDDIKLPGMLFGKILRSPHAHARIVSIDTSEAARMYGVRQILTGRDLPNIKFSFYPHLADKYPLCPDEVCYVGDEVAAVAADDPLTASLAIEAIKVVYELMTPIFSAEEALKVDAPRVHFDQDTNVSWKIHTVVGDVEEGFRDSDHVFEDRFESGRIAHCSMETRGSIAHFEQSGRLNIWSPTQAPHTLKQELARALNLPSQKIRVIRTNLGGGFGGRLVMDMMDPIAAVLSQRTGRPVKLVNTREEEFSTARTRYPYVIYLKTGVKNDGTIVVRQARVIVDNGAYNDKGPSTLNFAGVTFMSLYDIPNIQYDGYTVYTNKQYCTAMRGFGNPQLNFASESQLDDIAVKLGIDPIEIRLRNAVKPYTVNKAGMEITSCALTECLEAVRDKLKENSPVAGNDLAAHIRRGIGIAAMAHSGSGTRNYGFNGADTFIKVADDGKVTVISPVVEAGQGGSTVVAQIVAEVLGIPMHMITVSNQDTDIIPFDLGAFGSRSTFVCGNSAKSAAEDTRREVLEAASHLFKVDVMELSLREGLVYQNGKKEPLGSFAQVANDSIMKLGSTISGRGRYCDELAAQLTFPKDLSRLIPAYSYAVQAAEVEVDTETGEVKVLRIIAAHETGKTINNMMALGQVYGGIAQGIGFALKEELKIDAHGKVSNPCFVDYKVLRASDVPKLDVIFIESNDPEGPFGAKGIAEPPLVPTAPAIANAIYNAVGVRLRDLPMTPEKIVIKLAGNS